MKRRILVAVVLLATLLAAAVPAPATEATIALSGTGGAITLTATATFTAYEHCDDQSPPECTTVDSGRLWVAAGHPDHANAFAKVYSTGNGSITRQIELNAATLAQGTHTFTATALDSQGVEDVAVVVLEIDNTPTVALDPVDDVEGFFDITGRVQFAENPAGTEGTVSVYQVIPGYAMSLGQKSLEGTDIPFSFSQIRGGEPLDAGGLPNGVNRFRARARSANQTWSADANIDVEVDNTPEIRADDVGTVGGPFDISGTVDFKAYEGGVDGRIELFIDCTYDNCRHGRKDYEGKGICWSYGDIVGRLCDGGAMADGPHTLIVRAQAHNHRNDAPSRDVKTIGFEIDNTPVIQWTDPPQEVREDFDPGGTVVFQEVLDASEGTVELFMDTVSLGTRTADETTFTWHYSDFAGERLRVEAFSSGVHVLQVVARAHNGQTTTAEQSFTIEGLTPEANLGMPVCPPAVAAGGRPERFHDTNHPFAGNPVNFATGNKFHQEVDLDIPYPELPLRFVRHYNSQNPADGLLGHGWTASFFSERLEVENDRITLFQADGRQVRFHRVAEDRWENSTDRRRFIVAVDGGGHRLYEPDRSRKTFDVFGRLTRERNATGATFRALYYGGPNWCVYYSDHGPRLDFQTDGNGRLARLETPVGDFLYDYDARGNLTGVEKPDGTRRSYLYEDPYDPHNLTGIVDENGVRIGTYGYDDHDRAVLSEGAAGAGRVTIAYEGDFRRTVTDGRGESTAYRIWTDHGMGRIRSSDGPGCASCGGQGASFDYDERFLPVRQTDRRGTVTEFTWDDRGNVLTRTEAVGTAVERTSTYTWDPNCARVTSITRQSAAAPGETAVRTFTYDNKGNLLSRTDSGFDADGGPVERTTGYTWDAYGRVTAVDGPRTDVADVTTLEYFPHAEDQGNDRGMLRRVTDPSGHTLTFADYNAWRRPRRITDANGVCTDLAYDAMGRLASATTAGRTTAYDRDAAGRLTAVHGADGRSLRYGYTGAGLPKTVMDDTGGRIVYTYDAEGNRIREAIEDADGHPMRRLDFDFDAENRLAAVLYPTGGSETRVYDDGGLLIAVTDPAGRATGFAYDPLGRLVETVQPGGLATVFGYNGHDDLTGVTDAEGHATTYVRDDLGRVSKRISPDTGTTVYRYDGAGNLIEKTDAKGTTVTYSYDAAGRLTRAAFPDSSQDIAFSYDQGDSGKGRLTGMSDPSGTCVYGYDAWGNLVSEEKTVAGVVYTTTYAYDEANRTVSVGYPDGRAVTYTRDAAGRIAAVATTRDGETEPLAEAAVYKPFGPLTAVTFGDGTVRQVDYDLLYRPERIRVGETLDYAYTWDAAGNITAIADGLDASRSRVFAYDDLDRLTGAEGPFGQIAYTYDAIGNRLSKTVDGAVDAYSYEAGTSRLAGITGPNASVFDHDANGNMVRMGARDLVYNQNNRLIRVLENAAALGEYVYNGKGQRILKTTDEETVVFHYDLAGNLIGESNTDGVFDSVYVYMHGERLAAVGPNVSDEFSVNVVTDKGRALEGVRVYAFTESGAYTGKYAASDETGAAVFSAAEIGEGDFQFRADYLGSRFWSAVAELPGPASLSIEIPEETVTVRITQGGDPAEGVKVYLFSPSGSYLGSYAVTGADGTAGFDLPAGVSYCFRADLLGQRFMSDAFEVVSGEENTFTVPTGGGDLVVRLEEAAEAPLSGVRLYLFSAAGSYLGCRGDTDDDGEVVFAVPAGTYTVRADYLGQRFWSGDIGVTTDTEHAVTLPHKNVRIAVTGDLAGDVAPLAGVRAYLFTAAGSYTGRYVDTDEDGEAIFHLPAADFKVRADYRGGRFWSPVFHFADASLTIPETEAAVRVTGMGLGLEGVRVYVFSSSGSYLGLYDETDSDGATVFRLPAGDYEFRADHLGSRYYSGDVTLVAHETNPVTVSTGGGAFTLNLLKRADEPLAGVRCYLFSETDAYLGQYANTSDQGKIDFNLADGRYKIRSDYLSHRFWTDAFGVPDTLELDFLIPHEETTVRVLGDYGGDVSALAGVRVYLFSPSESYTGVYEETDAAGALVFDIPSEAFKVRADYLGGCFWQDVTGGVDADLVIPEGVARVAVAQGGNGLGNVKVYAFSEAGSYLGRYGWTDAAGEVCFRLPAATYSFRADHLGSRYWAVAPIAADQETAVPLDTGGGTFVLSVTKGAGVPIVDVPVYAFTVSGSYIGLSGHTDEYGQASFGLSDGGYGFRADYLRHRFWLDHVTIPDLLADTLEIPHTAETVSVNALYNGEATPLPGVKTYLFTDAGSYTGQSATTGSDGAVVYDLPQGDFAVRADYCGQRFWSETITGADTDLDIDHGVLAVTVEAAGAPAVDASVYLFSEAGAYLGQREYTDTAGQAEFFIPEGAYKLRIDHDGDRHWTDVIHLIPHEETVLNLNLDELALRLTNDPDPDRYDGRPPEYTQHLLASLIPVHQLMANAVTATNGWDNMTVHYFINDHLGTPQKVIDEEGNVVWDTDYWPFGEVDVRINRWDNRFRFPGQFFDIKTGLYYNYFRYYEHRISRYISRDPIGFFGGVNLYCYVQNNPIMFIDPYGLDWSDILPGVGTAISQSLQGGAYAVGQAANDTADIAINGPPLAQVALWFGVFSEVAPLVGATAISALPAATSAVYNIAPYSGAIVHFTYGLLTETGPPQGWGYLSSGGMFVYQEMKDYFTHDASLLPCGK